MRLRIGESSELAYGFSAGTLPYFQMEIGVPCMRAVLRATLAARRKARPTLAENSLPVCGLAFLFNGDLRQM